MSDLYIVYVVGQNVDMVDDPDVVVLDDGLYLVRSGQTRSQLYHVIKLNRPGFAGGRLV